MAKDNSDFYKEKKSWSIIKDDLLGCYLTPYFQKLLMTKKSITYIDCCAGKGKFNDGNNGSPLIALHIRDNCLGRTKRKYTHNPIDMSFIELQYAEELSQNISSEYPSLDGIHVLSGEYQDFIYDILKNKDRHNVFLYIDPYGIKTLDFELFKNLTAYNFNSLEILLNFNSFGFFRDACRARRVNTKGDAAFIDLEDIVENVPRPDQDKEHSEELLNRVAGGDYWQDIVSDYRSGKINGYQAEKRLSTEYKQHLKQYYRYVLDMPIKLKPNQHPKYRMIYVSNHVDGCCIMVQDIICRNKSLYFNTPNEYMPTLFNHNGSNVEDDYCALEEIEKGIINYLPKINGEVRLTPLLANFYNDNGIICDFKKIRSILEKLEHDGTIAIRREPDVTKTGKPTSFWEEKKGNKIILKRIR